jgi:hypothetical protein
MPDRRITIEEVEEAYRVRGLEPTDWTYLEEDAEQADCFGVLAPAGLDCNGIHAWACAEFGNEYRGGFVHGFDRERPKKARWADLVKQSATDRERYDQGFADGQAVAAAVFQKQGASE